MKETQMNHSPAMIEAAGLTKIYGRFAAVTDVSFRLRRGEVVAFLGPNGAGKSTTMKLLTGFLTPTSGQARIAGLNMQTDRIDGAAKLGYLPENGPLYPDMTPESLLNFFAEIRTIPKQARRTAVERVVELCDLKSVVHKPIGKLSKGYRQRVGMANALLHEPDALILDEPTTGLDPNQIEQVRRTLRRVGREKTILLSTHILQEVEAVATRVIFITRGRIVFDGTVAEFSDGTNSEERFRELSEAV